MMRVDHSINHIRKTHYKLVLSLKSESLHSRSFSPNNLELPQKASHIERWPRRSRHPFTISPRLEAEPLAPLGTWFSDLLTTDRTSPRILTSHRHKNQSPAFSHYSCVKTNSFRYSTRLEIKWRNKAELMVLDRWSVTDIAYLSSHSHIYCLINSAI